MHRGFSQQLVSAKSRIKCSQRDESRRGSSLSLLTPALSFPPTLARWMVEISLPPIRGLPLLLIRSSSLPLNIPLCTCHSPFPILKIAKRNIHQGHSKLYSCCRRGHTEHHSCMQSCERGLFPHSVQAQAWYSCQTSFNHDAATCLDGFWFVFVPQVYRLVSSEWRHCNFSHDKLSCWSFSFFPLLV